MELIINIPDNIAAKSKITEQDAKLALAIKLYIHDKLTLRQAAEVADINWFDFQKELLKGKYLP